MRQTLAAFFARHRRSAAIFRAVRAFVIGIGSVEMEVLTSQIAFRARTRLAWAWLPQMCIRNAPEDALVLTLALGRQVRSRKVKQVVEVRPGRWTHHIVLRNENDFDADVQSWLREAHDLATRPAKAAARNARKTKTMRPPREPRERIPRV